MKKKLQNFKVVDIRWIGAMALIPMTSPFAVHAVASEAGGSLPGSGTASWLRRMSSIPGRVIRFPAP